MSKTTSISLAIVGALFILIGGLWYIGMLQGLTSALNLDILDDEAQNETASEDTQRSESELTTGSDTSDEALAEDAAVLDSQLEGYNELSTDLDASLEDEPVEQETDF